MASTHQSSAAAALKQSSPERALDAFSKPRTKLLAALRKPTAESSESEADSENESSASEDESPAITTVSNPLKTSRPQVDTDQANDLDESDGEDAYELMKKRLAANKTLPAVEAVPQQAQQTTQAAATIESSDDEDAMPVRAKVRRPVAKTTKTASPDASPSPNARLRSTTPGLFVTPDPSPAKKKYRSSVNAGSDSETSQLSQNDDLQERVRRIREERLAKQQEQEAQPTKPKKTTRRRNSDSGSDTDDDSNSGRGHNEDEESFLQQWRESRRRELESEASRTVRNRRTSPSVRVYGRLDEVDAMGYLDAIEKVGRETVVVVFVYDHEVSC